MSRFTLIAVSTMTLTSLASAPTFHRGNPNRCDCAANLVVDQILDEDVVFVVEKAGLQDSRVLQDLRYRYGYVRGVGSSACGGEGAERRLRSKQRSAPCRTRHTSSAEAGRRIVGGMGIR